MAGNLTAGEKSSETVIIKLTSRHIVVTPERASQDWHTNGNLITSKHLIIQTEQ